jgi:hypothetical protein
MERLGTLRAMLKYGLSQNHPMKTHQQRTPYLSYWDVTVRVDFKQVTKLAKATNIDNPAKIIGFRL